MLGRAGGIGFIALAAAGCHHGPPPDFAPDPAVLARIVRIQMLTSPAVVCPGQQIQTEYDAVLNDSSTVPFESRYDKKHPPRLHVVFLRRTSPEAVPQEDGDWTTNRDPLLSAMHGFRLTAFLLANPSINTSAVVAPEYSCMPHAFGFSGATGGQNVPGEDGPDVTVRVGILRSPYVNRLLVASIEVGQAPPLFVMADADRVPPSDWLIVETRGGRGGRGTDGAAGQKGSAGQAGCPGTTGGPGGAGGSGGVGASGGRGGRVTVIGPQTEPFLVGLVEGRSLGGEGGPGGRGGKGGAGGAGGPARVPEGSPPDRRCMAASQGPNGADGAAGTQGPPGVPGPRPQTLTLPAREVFAPIAQMVPELAALVDYAQGNRRR